MNYKEGSVVDNFTIASPTVTAAPSAIVAPMAAVAPMAISAPDIIVTSLSYANGLFNSTVKNQGIAETPAGGYIGVGYFVDGVQKTYGGVVGSLAAGESVTIGTDGGSFTIPDGNHTIKAHVDDVNRFAESSETNNIFFQTVIIGGTVETQDPTVPTGLTARAVSSSQINLSWTASTDNEGVAGYKIFRAGTQVGTATTNSYSNTGLSAGTGYIYTVSAYDAAGNSSGNSTAVNAETLSGSPARDYRFDGSISLPVLQNYLSRAIQMGRLCEGIGDNTDNIRMLKSIGAKHLGRVFHPFGSEDLFQQRLQTTKTIAAQIHAMDPDIILGGGIYEYVSTQVNTLRIPAYVFEAFNLPVENRNFRQEDMVFANNPIINRPYTVPDITKMKTRLWFYYSATAQIDAGIKSLDWGFFEAQAYNDKPNYTNYYDMFAKVRLYAKTHAARHYVLNSAGANFSISIDGKLLLDFGASNLHANGIKEVTTDPQKAILTGRYSRSGRGITPSGWSSTQLPFLVHLDNTGYSGKGGTPGLGGSWTWGWNEISWFANQPEAYRNEFLGYADNYITRCSSF